MQHECSLLCSQENDTGPYGERQEPSSFYYKYLSDDVRFINERFQWIVRHLSFNTVLLMACLNYGRTRLCLLLWYWNRNSQQCDTTALHWALSWASSFQLTLPNKLKKDEVFLSFLWSTVFLLTFSSAFLCLPFSRHAPTILFSVT
jgi:hypothetical protein